jgi:hypothetical protein
MDVQFCSGHFVRPVSLHAPDERAAEARLRTNSRAQVYDRAAPPHSITSSARTSSVAGTVRPSALAVITISNFVGC